VADEDLVCDFDAAADERVALDLASCANHGITLDFDKRPDTRLVADVTAVEVREGRDDDASSEGDVIDQATGGLVHRLTGHRQPPP
jgi:hypothetical protein